MYNIHALYHLPAGTLLQHDRTFKKCQNMYFVFMYTRRFYSWYACAHAIALMRGCMHAYIYICMCTHMYTYMYMYAKWLEKIYTIVLYNARMHACTLYTWHMQNGLKKYIRSYTRGYHKGDVYIGSHGIPGISY